MTEKVTQTMTLELEGSDFNITFDPPIHGRETEEHKAMSDSEKILQALTERLATHCIQTLKRVDESND